VSDGWIGSFDAGEFGNTAWWFSNDGARREPLGTFVTALVRVGDEPWLFEGFDTLEKAGGGAAYRAVHSDGRWHLVEFGRFEEAVNAVVTETGTSVLVATRSHVLRLDRSGTVTTLYDGDAGGNSIAIGDGGSLFIGSMHGVVRLDPVASGYTAVWLVSPTCLEPSDGGCPCARY
jgi:hypothetical protein